jgi:hypothetical protein
MPEELVAGRDEVTGADELQAPRRDERIVAPADAVQRVGGAQLQGGENATRQGVEPYN